MGVGWGEVGVVRCVWGFEWVCVGVGRWVLVWEGGFGCGGVV